MGQAAVFVVTVHLEAQRGVRADIGSSGAKAPISF
jgi:hypothetical protein